MTETCSICKKFGVQLYTITLEEVFSRGGRLWHGEMIKSMKFCRKHAVLFFQYFPKIKQRQCMTHKYWENIMIGYIDEEIVQEALESYNDTDED